MVGGLKVVLYNFKKFKKGEGPTFFAKLKNFFAKLIFFPPKLFFGILEKGNLSEQKKFGGKKINLAKNHFPKSVTLSFSPNFKFKICQTCLDLEFRFI